MTEQLWSYWGEAIFLKPQVMSWRERIWIHTPSCDRPGRMQSQSFLLFIAIATTPAAASVELFKKQWHAKLILTLYFWQQERILNLSTDGARAGWCLSENISNCMFACSKHVQLNLFNRDQQKLCNYCNVGKYGEWNFHGVSKKDMCSMAVVLLLLLSSYICFMFPVQFW